MPRKIWYSETADVYPGIIARNNAVLEYNKFVHRTFYPYIIHPYSSLSVHHLKFFIVNIAVRISVISLLWTVLPHNSYMYVLPKLFFQLVNIADVIFNFFVGYVEFDTETVVLDPKKIAVRYLLTYFFFDFIPAIPEELVVLMLDVTCVWRTTSEPCSRYNVLVHVAMFGNVLRLVSLFRYWRDLARILLWNYYLMSMIYVGFLQYTTLIFANNLYIMMHIKEPNSEEPLGERVVKCLDAMTTLILDCLFYDAVSPISNPYIRCFILVATFFLSLLFLSYFIQYFILKMKAKDTEKFFDLESRVVTFVKKKRLSSSLGAKTLLYFYVLLENKYYGRDDEVFNYIPETFKADIFFHLCFPLLKNFYAFEDLPTYVLRRLAECMKYQLHLPNELIMRNEDEVVSMYFVQRGTVALYSVKHVELYHFEAGSSFNGKNMILGETTNNGYAISIEVVEVYRLSQEDFFDIMSSYPKMLKDVQDKFKDDRNENILD